MTSLSVVLPNYNGKALLKKNLPSVYAALEYAKIDYEIIVSDDNSKDDSLEFLKENYPEITIITNDKNLGFSGNINRGLKKASKDLVLALNTDVELNEDYFIKQIPYFSKSDVFGVMGALKDPVTKEVIVGAKKCKQKFWGDIQSTKNLISKDNEPLISFYLSGANALIDRKKLSDIGYFNEIYSPFYREDTDLSLRAWRMGWQCFFEPGAIGYHETSSTIQSNNKKKFIDFISRRNKMFFHYLHLDGKKRLLYFTKLFFDFLSRWLKFDMIFYKSLFAYLKKIKTLKHLRKEYRLLKKPTQDVVEYITNEQNKKEYINF